MGQQSGQQQSGQSGINIFSSNQQGGQNPSNQVQGQQQGQQQGQNQG